MTTASDLKRITADLSEIIRSPKRVTVTEACAEALRIGDADHWTPDDTPYMLRPMNETASRQHHTVCFMGPARTGKTFGLILGRWVYTVCNHPMDFMIVHSSQDLARDLSNRELKRLHKYSQSMINAQTGNARDNNTYDKTYRSGIIANIGWPSNTQLASRTIYVMLLTDYDRWPGDIGGEGNGFQQARKRTQTAGSLAMTVVESSPGSNWADPKWKREPFVLGKPLQHLAPPSVSGVRANIAPIYNNGTREWWYVPCQSCGEYYPQNADISRFSWGESKDPVAAAAESGTVCCWCGTVHGEETKKTENANGVWLAEGETIDCEGRIRGESRKGHVYPSFWLGGGAARYQTRPAIVEKYLGAINEYGTTGDESGLKFVVNGDIGAPYLPRSDNSLNDEELIDRAEDIPRFHVPAFVRVLVAAVDIQGNRFVVQIIGFGPGLEKALVDRFNIKQAKNRENDDVAPASYLEDWEQLLSLIGRLYPLEANPDKSMAVRWVVCDSGGAAGVTANAYKFWAKFLLPASLHQRFFLVKGQDTIGAKPISKSFPGKSGRRQVVKFAHTAMPVYVIASNYWKDEIAGCLNRKTPGPGYVHFPQWLGQWFYDELTAETRDPVTGKWSEVSKSARNEAFDLFCYAEALANFMGLDKTNWSNPPLHLADQMAGNSMVIDNKDASNPIPTKPLKKSAPKKKQQPGNWLSVGDGWL